MCSKVLKFLVSLAYGFKYDCYIIGGDVEVDKERGGFIISPRNRILLTGSRMQL